ncbi:Transmembrane protein 50B [Echinococcus granulosus]|uniref:Transmembrane protein 50B n=1 Tax=Echinococcus granulosus TaxID=6210 RepID=U6IX81_ECHGR|nr:Transmembrane protein 50B [Echinococcus granulosus]EUB57060.1 Transmembrane protein 50B [Echinococcus granulosus]KAH9286973.1 Transmembrane protein 50B [Echinococcus granulosus]CDS16394.1 transmembrane protein 50B [Echinococcus granulosus]
MACFNGPEIVPDTNLTNFLSRLTRRNPTPMVSYRRFPEVNIDVGLRNTIVAVLSGIAFACGWWVIIDAAACYGPESLPHPTHAIGAIATVGFILLNIIPQHALTSDIEDPKACTVLFVGVLTNFVTLIAAAWVMFASYVTGNIKPVWPGVALFLQNLLIFIAAFLFRFGRYHESFSF